MKNKATNIILFLIFTIILKNVDCVYIFDSAKRCLSFSYRAHTSSLFSTINTCVDHGIDYGVLTDTRFCLNFEKIGCDKNNSCKYKIISPISSPYTGMCITKSNNEYLTYKDCNNADYFRFNNGSIYTHNSKCLRIEYSGQDKTCSPYYYIGIKGNKCGNDFKETK